MRWYSYGRWKRIYANWSTAGDVGHILRDPGNLQAERSKKRGGELPEANAQVLEAKRGQLAAVRASKASEAAHKMTLQSKQWDRGKMRVQQ